MLRVFGILVLSALAVHADESPPPALKRLEEAKKKFAAAKTEANAKVLEWFGQQEDGARKKGDRKAVLQTTADRDEYVKSGALPAATPVAVKTRLEAAQKALEAEYGVAIKDLTKARADELAGKIENELHEFRQSLTPFYREFGGKPVRIVNRHSDKLLCPRGASDKDGTDLFQWQATGERAQTWAVVPAEDGHYFLRNADSNKLAGRLADNDSAIVLTPKTGKVTDRNHQWRLTPVTGERNYYLIQNRVTGKYITVDNGDKNSGGTLSQSKLKGQTGGPDQQWRLEKAED
jgi:hypothetical protein